VLSPALWSGGTVVFFFSSLLQNRSLFCRRRREEWTKRIRLERERKKSVIGSTSHKRISISIKIYSFKWYVTWSARPIFYYFVKMRWRHPVRKKLNTAHFNSLSNLWRPTAMGCPNRTNPHKIISTLRKPAVVPKYLFLHFMLP
jgi:hypothetical protein